MEYSNDICADQIERMIRSAGATGHAGLVLREHHNKLIAELEARNKRLAEALRGAADNIAWKWPADARRMRELADSN